MPPALLIIAFGGVTTALIPLYAVGVFMSFTLSQFGMVVHHRKEAGPGYKRRMAVSGFGSFLTFVVLIIVATTKFIDGAWVPLVVIPSIILLFKSIHKHYKTVAAGLAVTPDFKVRKMNHTVVVLVGSIHKGVLEALAYSKSLRPNRLVALSVVSDEEEQAKIEEAWEEYQMDIPLEILYSPVPGARPAGAALRRRARRPAGQRHRDHRDPGVRRRVLVGPAPPQPERPVPQGPAALPEEHGRDVRAVPRRLSGPRSSSGRRAVGHVRRGLSRVSPS